MASLVSKFPYRRLKQEFIFDDYDQERERITVRSTTTWFKLKRVHIRRRFRLKVPSLRRLSRRKIRLVSCVRGSWAKVLKRLKESQANFGDLFAGNYLFMQVNPTSLKCLEKSYGISINGLPPNFA